MEKTKKIFLKNIKWFVLLLALIFFIYILQNIYSNEELIVDSIFYSFIVEQLRSDFLTSVFTIITQLASAPILIAICILSFIILKNKEIGLFLTSNLVISYIINIVLKNIVQRQRPVDFRLIEESGYSFPSGHSMISMAFYGLIIYFIYTKVQNKYLKWFLCILFGLLIPLIGLSRIYLGVHYASDVIAGFVISIAYLIIFTSVISTIQTRYPESQ